VATASDLPLDDNQPGDARVTLDTNEIWLWTGTNFVPAAQAWTPSEYELQLVPLAGPINSRRVVFKVTSEGETESLNGVRVGGPATTPATIATVGARISSGNGDPNGVITGSVGDLWLRLDGGAGTTLYVKESGAATTAGWVGK
jgi:hypothetical protein